MQTIAADHARAERFGKLMLHEHIPSSSVPKKSHLHQRSGKKTLGQRGLLRPEEDPGMEYLDEDEERFEDIDLDKISQNDYEEAAAEEEEEEIEYGEEDEEGYGLGSEDVPCADAADEGEAIDYD